MRGETLLITLITGITGYVTEKNNKKISIFINFTQLRHRQDNTDMREIYVYVFLLFFCKT